MILLHLEQEDRILYYMLCVYLSDAEEVGGEASGPARGPGQATAGTERVGDQRSGQGEESSGDTAGITCKD